MKTEIHPKYHQAKVTCACGNEFVVGSTKSEIKLDICSACHPFFTGTQKFVDTAGRVDKFFRKYGEEAQTRVAKKKKVRRAADQTEVQALMAEGEDSVLEDVASEITDAPAGK